MQEHSSFPSRPCELAMYYQLVVMGGFFFNLDFGTVNRDGEPDVRV
ncbi:unnamed protein product [marine sediment metagenome]|uniref:Uncharacterized protein n=1 Tax=marine sediment metagenome TaxID=412755 RepID=X0X5L4_9ZZZZ